MISVDDKKQAVYTATLRLISEYGFQGTPMSRIAKEAGVSIGIIYHYFTGKEDLLNSLYIKILADYRNYVLSQIPENLTTEEKLKRMLLHIMLYYRVHEDELSFTQQYENTPLILDKTRKEKQKLFTPVFDLFASAKKEMLLKDLPTELLIGLSFNAVIAMAKMSLSGMTGSEEKTLSAGLNAIWGMVKK